ncbi:MAG: helix-turn-helix transcriptional regulator [Clostridia bacterium]|nr:helix-turn-helix transcriptional regulator [Clostridia bacterium]
MHNKKITYDDVAEKLGVSKAYVSMILNGSRKPNNIRKRFEEAVKLIIAERKYKAKE